LPFIAALKKKAATEDGLLKQLFWCLLQIAAFGGTLWVFNQPDVKGDFGPYGVGVVALMVTMAVTAAAMIVRDLFLFCRRRFAALGQPDKTNDGQALVGPVSGLRQPRKFTPGSWVREEPRQIIDRAAHPPVLDARRDL
jgi:hypothetical protein